MSDSSQKFAEKILLNMINGYNNSETNSVNVAHIEICNDKKPIVKEDPEVCQKDQGWPSVGTYIGSYGRNASGVKNSGTDPLSTFNSGAYLVFDMGVSSRLVNALGEQINQQKSLTFVISCGKNMKGTPDGNTRYFRQTLTCMGINLQQLNQYTNTGLLRTFSIVQLSGIQSIETGLALSNGRHITKTNFSSNGKASKTK